MEDCRHLQQQPFPFPHSMDLFHGVENHHSHVPHCFGMAGITLIAFRQIPGSGKDILLKIMLKVNHPVFPCIIADNPITDINSRHPDIFCIQLLAQPLIQHYRRQD